MTTTPDTLEIGLFDSQADSPASIETLDDVRSEPRDGAYRRKSYTGYVPDHVKFKLRGSHGPVDSVFVARRTEQGFNTIEHIVPLARRHRTMNAEDITVRLEGNIIENTL